MASFDLPPIPEPRVSPNLLVGVASPLWSYFGAAAAGGVAFWWMTRWTRPVNLEALMGVAAKAIEPAAEPGLVALEAAVEAVEEVPPAVVQAAEAVADPVIAPAPEPDETEGEGLEPNL